jgi:hypothetical protein
MLDQEQSTERRASESTHGTPIYRRQMPGGGYVEVELDALPDDAARDARGGPMRGRVVMERRADPGRRSGHPAPVVAELAGDDRDELMADLFRLAQDNAALARSLMRMHAARERTH